MVGNGEWTITISSLPQARVRPAPPAVNFLLDRLMRHRLESAPRMEPLSMYSGKISVALPLLLIIPLIWQSGPMTGARGRHHKMLPDGRHRSNGERMNRPGLLPPPGQAVLPQEGARSVGGDAPPAVTLLDAPLIKLPGRSVPEESVFDMVDSNSPAHWGMDGSLYLFTSAGSSYRSAGPDLFTLGRPAESVAINNDGWFPGGRWVEATFKDKDGTLYGWYHNEMSYVCEGRGEVTVPRIGAMVSYDDGAFWHDLGVVLDAPPGSFECGTYNYYFAGGNGDFSVILDRQGDYFYFFMSTYHRDPREQGVSVARMRYEDRDNPVGKVFKYHESQWRDDGVGGRVTPVFRVESDWHQEAPNAFWGPSVHFNTYLGVYVMLLNRATDSVWSPGGVYVSFSRDPAESLGWSEPALILETNAWYPQVIGLERGGTDKVAGRVARLFVGGESRWEIAFGRHLKREPPARRRLAFPSARPRGELLEEITRLMFP